MPCEDLEGEGGRERVKREGHVSTCGRPFHDVVLQKGTQHRTAITSQLGKKDCSFRAL